jgi:hypothetical protein
LLSLLLRLLYEYDRDCIYRIVIIIMIIIIIVIIISCHYSLSIQKVFNETLYVTTAVSGTLQQFNIFPRFAPLRSLPVGIVPVGFLVLPGAVSASDTAFVCSTVQNDIAEVLKSRISIFCTVNLHSSNILLFLKKFKVNLERWVVVSRLRAGTEPDGLAFAPSVYHST